MMLPFKIEKILNIIKYLYLSHSNKVCQKKKKVKEHDNCIK